MTMPQRYVEMIEKICLARSDAARGKIIDDLLSEIAADLHERYPDAPPYVARTCAATFTTRLVIFANETMKLLVERSKATVH